MVKPILITAALLGVAVAGLIGHSAGSGPPVVTGNARVDALLGQQVYLGAPKKPPSGARFAVRALAAFDRVRIPAGGSKKITLHVPLRPLQYWSTSANHWATAAGSRTVTIAASSRDMRLQAAINIAARSAAR